MHRSKTINRKLGFHPIWFFCVTYVLIILLMIHHNDTSTNANNPAATKPVAVTLKLEHQKYKNRHYENTGPIYDSSTAIDIAVVYSCLPKRLSQFLENCDISTGWNIRFLFIKYSCDSPERFPDKINSYPVLLSESVSKPFSRSSNINMLHKMARSNSLLVVVDVDIIIHDFAISNIIRYVRPGTAYFPIIWSKYSQKSIQIAEKFLKIKFPDMSKHTGLWRNFGFGIFCIHHVDFSRVKMNEQFTTWGGEDDDLYNRIKSETDISIVREKDFGFEHEWHEKNCTPYINTDKYISCMGSKSELMGSKLLMSIEKSKSFKKLPVRAKYISPNEILSKTVFVVKTFERFNCLVDLLESLSKYAPWLPIIIADDSKTVMNISSTYNVVKYMKLPFDVGVGHGRNSLIVEAKRLGYEYVLMSDDDYVINSHDLIPKMAGKLLKINADVVAPTRCEIGEEDTGEEYSVSDCNRGTINSFRIMENGGMSILPNVTRDAPKYGCMQSDIVQQFFIGKTSVLLDAWDNHLKSNDHYDAMLNLKKRSAKVFQCDMLQIIHNNKKCAVDYKQTYTKKRFDQWLRLMPYVIKKHNLTWLTDEVGRNWSINHNGKIQTQCGESCLKIPAYTKLKDEELNSIELRINSIRPAHDQITFLHDKNMRSSHVYKRDLNRCQMIVVLNKLGVKWKNRKKGKNFEISFQMYHPKWCRSNLENPVYKKYETIRAKHLFYVIPISDTQLLLDTTIRQDLRKQRRGYDYKIHVIYVVLGTSNKISLFKNEHILRHPGPFSRAIALKIGFEYISQNIQNAKDVIAMAMDVKMSIPDDFSDIVMSNTICGFSTFQPISQERINKRWIESGFGMASMCLDDYFKLTSGWNEVLGYNWGAEDLDLIYQIQQTGLHINRFRIKDFVHVSMHDRRTYYAKKNFLGKYLPIVPQTRLINQSNIQRNVLDFIEKRLKRSLKNYEIRSKLLERNQLITIQETIDDKIIVHQVYIQIPFIASFEQDTWRVGAARHKD